MLLVWLCAAGAIAGIFKALIVTGITLIDLNHVSLLIY